MILFTKGESNAKTAKSEAAGMGFSTLIQHLAPAKLSDYEVCSSRSIGCTIACLNTAGRGRMGPIQLARINRTLMFFQDRPAYMVQATKELTAFCRKCDKVGSRPCVRMNGTSDLMWEVLWPELFHKFSDVQWYDYTKHFKRCLPGYALPSNYHLTFSRSESNQDKVVKVLAGGRWNVAAVFNSKNFPQNIFGFPTYSADEDDLRFLDPPGGHVGCLYAKGKGKKDATGFVLAA
jgi:hypothetical protein